MVDAAERAGGAEMKVCMSCELRVFKWAPCQVNERSQR